MALQLAHTVAAKGVCFSTNSESTKCDGTMKRTRFQRLKSLTILASISILPSLAQERHGELEIPVLNDLASAEMQRIGCG